MQSSKFGVIWDTMFLIAAGYETNSLSRKEKDPGYIQFFNSFTLTLPCKKCRDTVPIYLKKLNIQKYLDSNQLLKFVYDLKECVNDKLRDQENEQLKDTFDGLSHLYRNGSPEFWDVFRKEAEDICKTQKTPDFSEVKKKWDAYRSTGTGGGGGGVVDKRSRKSRKTKKVVINDGHSFR